MIALPQLEQMEQGCADWHALRKTKITATDASVIMGASHWKTRIQLYHEKLSDDAPMPPNERMQRGVDLEPVARDLFNVMTGYNMRPAVVVKDWRMASFDGVSECGNYTLEIKCPGVKDHSTALSGKIPDHYYPQLQHHIEIKNPKKHFYFSFDGMDGVIVEVKRDDYYIEKMLIEEKRFYDCLMNRTPPEPIEGDYIERSDALWEECSMKWKALTNSIKALEEDQEELRKQIIFLSGESNTKGAGISLCQIQRKGNVEYSRIPALKGMDLEPYRKASINSWRITCA